MDIGSIGTALAAIKTSIDMVRTAVDIRDDNKLTLALQVVQDKLLSLTLAATDVAEKNATLVQELAAARQRELELQQRIAELERRATEHADYELTELAAGQWVYMHSPSVNAGKRPHYLCSACLKQGQQAILNEITSVGVVYMKCPLCKNKYNTGRCYDIGI